MAATKRKKTTKSPTKKSTSTRVKTVKAKKKTTSKTTAKSTAKKSSAKAKTTAKKMTAAKVSDPFKKSELLSTIADMTEQSKKEVSATLEALSMVLGEHIRKKGPGQFTLPGLLKVVIQKKPATKARKGINPFTGEETTFKAKPARRVVKIRALKNLKEMAEKA